LARGAEQRRARVWGERAGQSRRRRGRADRRTRPLSVARLDAPAARHARVSTRGGDVSAAVADDADGRRRAVIEGVTPEIDCGRLPVRRVTGGRVTVEADIFTDGHDQIAALLLFRKAGEAAWQETLLEPLRNDRWRARFRVTTIGRYQYTLVA